MKEILRKEVDEILTNKLNDVIKEFEAQRDQDLEELAALRKAVEDLETEKESIQKKMAGLNTRRSREMGEHNRLTQRLSRFPKVFKMKRAQIEELMIKLTEIDISPKTLNLILASRGKDGGKNAKD